MLKDPAFPGFELNSSGQLYDSWPGMTLRDYFAAKIMASFVVDPFCSSPDRLAKLAYQWADEMMTAREAVPEFETQTKINQGD